MQANEEQKKKWLPLAAQHRILGAYAQTELGHGEPPHMMTSLHQALFLIVSSQGVMCEAWRPLLLMMWTSRSLS